MFLFADLDLTSLANVLLASGNLKAAAVGAAVLFVIQVAGGSKLDLSGVVKRLLGKSAPVVEPEPAAAEPGPPPGNSEPVTPGPYSPAVERLVAKLRDSAYAKLQAIEEAAAAKLESELASHLGIVLATPTDPAK